MLKVGDRIVMTSPSTLIGDRGIIVARNNTTNWWVVFDKGSRIETCGIGPQADGSRNIHEGNLTLFNTGKQQELFT